jgi:predicted permease
LATCVTPDYLKVMGIALREGRFFTDQDRLGKQSVVVIDELMAQQAFPGQNPIGKRLWIDLGGDPVVVVGVVGYVRYWGPAGDDKAAVRAQLYYPIAQVPDKLLRRWSELMSITVRTSVEPLSILEPLRRAVRGPGRDQVLYEVRTMEQLARESIARQRFLVLLFGIFAGIALLLASIGIYGVLAYLTSRRVPEIGVRMALGASAHEVVRLVLRDSMAMIFAGVAVGAAGAWAAGQYLARSVDGVRSMEPLTSALMIAILVCAALLASYAPARRASRLDPMRALRVE